MRSKKQHHINDLPRVLLCEIISYLPFHIPLEKHPTIFYLQICHLWRAIILPSLYHDTTSRTNSSIVPSSQSSPIVQPIVTTKNTKGNNGSGITVVLSIFDLQRSRIDDALSLLLIARASRLYVMDSMELLLANPFRSEDDPSLEYEHLSWSRLTHLRMEAATTTELMNLMRSIPTLTHIICDRLGFPRDGYNVTMDSNRINWRTLQQLLYQRNGRLNGCTPSSTCRQCHASNQLIMKRSLLQSMLPSPSDIENKDKTVKLSSSSSEASPTSKIDTLPAKFINESCQCCIHVIDICMSCMMTNSLSAISIECDYCQPCAVTRLPDEGEYKHFFEDHPLPPTPAIPCGVRICRYHTPLSSFCRHHNHAICFYHTSSQICGWNRIPPMLCPSRWCTYCARLSSKQCRCGRSSDAFERSQRDRAHRMALMKRGFFSE
jgi:hypothetical protein